MKHLADKVAVVTGAASGIGRAIAEACAHESMRVVLADVEEAPLRDARDSIARTGARAIAVRADVSELADVERLAQETLRAFGSVHLVCNNAGVATSGPVWETPIDAWRWVLGVNLWGVVHGVRVFVPILLAQGTEGHVVNTASMAGLVSEPGLGAYKASKHAVVSISETLHHDLRRIESRVGVSVLCPGFVRTRIVDSHRNRPASAAAPDGGARASPAKLAEQEAARQAIEAGLDPSTVAGRALDAVREQRFYVLTHPEWKPRIRARMEDVLLERDPTPPPSSA